MKCLALMLSVLAGCLAISADSRAQDRDLKVRNDRAALKANEIWIYNDIDTAIAESKKTGKPIFAALRCIPCEACSQFDKQLLEDGNLVHDLLGKFVCVRIVQANHLDLSLFQIDYDQSFHAMFLGPDKTVYARYGTRSARKEDEDMTLAGLKETMLAVLKAHADPAGNKALLAGKQPLPTTIKFPEDYPSLKAKYGPKIDYEGQTAKSCIHCHQVRDAERRMLRDAGKPMSDKVLFPYPLPDVLGLAVNPNQKGTIKQVAAGSLGEQAGLKAGDELLEIGGQSIYSTADLQWALHNFEELSLPVKLLRAGKPIELSVALPADWRRRGDISWRTTTWELRRMATGGMKLIDAGDEKRKTLSLPADTLALLVTHVGQYGDYATAKNAGFLKDDIILSIDGQKPRWSESEWIAYAVGKPKGHVAEVQVQRGAKQLKLKLPLK